jgi:hypothetical protein
MFILREGPERAANARKLKAWLLRLRDEIAEIHTLSVDLNEIPAPTEADMLMLAAYRMKTISPWCAPIRSTRR